MINAVIKLISSYLISKLSRPSRLKPAAGDKSRLDDNRRLHWRGNSICYGSPRWADKGTEMKFPNSLSLSLITYLKILITSHHVSK